MSPVQSVIGVSDGRAGERSSAALAATGRPHGDVCPAFGSRTSTHGSAPLALAHLHSPRSAVIPCYTGATAVSLCPQSRPQTYYLSNQMSPFHITSDRPSAKPIGSNQHPLTTLTTSSLSFSYIFTSRQHNCTARIEIKLKMRCQM